MCQTVIHSGDNVEHCLRSVLSGTTTKKRWLRSHPTLLFSKLSPLDIFLCFRKIGPWSCKMWGTVNNTFMWYVATVQLYLQCSQTGRYSQSFPHLVCMVNCC